MSSRQRANPPWNAPRGMARMICVLTLFLACMVSGTAFAKKAEYQTRLSAGVRAKLVDNLYLDASVQQRSDLLFTDIHQYLPKVKLGYKVFDFLSVEAGVRYAYVVEDGNRKLRLFQDLGTRTPSFWMMKLGYRLRFQQSHNADKDEWTPKIRNKVGLSLDISSYFKPGMYYEHFIHTDKEFGEMSTEYRVGLMFKSRIAKAHKFNMKLFREAGLNGDDDLTFVCEVAYGYSF